MEDRVSKKVLSTISKLDAIITKLEESYKYLKEKAILDQLVYLDLERMIKYDQKLDEIKAIGFELMLIKNTLELMHGNQVIDTKALKEIEKITTLVLPEFAIDLRELEPYAVESNIDFIKEAITLAEERIKKWGEFE